MVSVTTVTNYGALLCWEVFMKSYKNFVPEEDDFKWTGKKRLLVIGHKMDYSGAPRSLLGLIKELHAEGHYKVNVIGMQGGELANEYMRHSSSTEILSTEYEISYLKKIMAFFKLAIIIINLKPDLILINSASNMRAILSSFLLRKPTVLYLREFDDMLSKNKIFLYIRKRALLLVSEVIAVSKKNAEWMRSLGYHGKITVVHNGVDNQITQKLLEFEPPDDYIEYIGGKKVVAIVGYMSYRKGIDLFLEIAKLIKNNERNVVFVIIGDFDDQTMKERFEQNEIRAEFFLTGFTDNVFKYIKYVDVVCLTSRSEALPRVVMESVSLGVPVVTFDVGGTSELLPDGYGFIVPPFDTNLFSQKILSLLRCKHLSDATSYSLKVHSEGFTVNATAHRVSQVLYHVINDQG
jgi:glycosyltransferase involved in cell wall biosynthesis